jgi:echinoid protein
MFSTCRVASYVTMFPQFTVLLLLAAWTGLSMGQTFDTRPQDSSVRETENVVLECRYRDRDPSKSISWTKYTGDSAQTIFIDNKPWTGNTRYNVTYIAIGQDVSGYDLKITGATKEEDDDYQCALQQSNLQARVKLTVLVVPGRPVIALNNTAILEEGDFLALNCSSSGGNPAPRIQWLRNNQPLSDIDTITPSDKFGTTWSLLVRELTRFDHNTEYRCLVENDAITGAPLQDAQVLTVLYAPVITFGDYNPLQVIENSRPVLDCLVDAQPPVEDMTIVWIRDGSQIASGSRLELDGHKGDTGTYKCRATNIVGTQSDDLVLDVQYGPKVGLRANEQPIFDGQSVTINEDRRMNMTCIVDANPPILGSIEWQRDEGDVLETGPYNIIEKVSRAQAGDYSCQARNQLTPSGEGVLHMQGKQMMELLVHHRPGRANITGPLYAIKGQAASLDCNVNDAGVPAAWLEWTNLKANSRNVIHQGPVLEFDLVDLNDNGDYSCTPRNDVGQGEPTTFNFIVNELPEWFDGGRLPVSQIININQQGLSVSCHVRGRPKPQIRWYKDGAPITEFDGLWRIDTIPSFTDVISFDVKSTLYWEGSNRDNNKMRIEDAGVYSCKASNEISLNTLSSDMQLIVEYAPMLNSTADKVAIDINQSAILVCRCHSVPAPTYTWYNGTAQMTTGGRIRITEAEVPGSHPYQSILNISDVTPHDLGLYKCVAVNAIGPSQVMISLTVKTIPDHPTSLRLVSHTWESAELEWVPGFDGGYPQWFIMTATSLDHSVYRMEVDPPQAARFNMTHLYPDVHYTFKVFGENELGGGAYSRNLSVITNFFEIAPPTDVTYQEEDMTLLFKSPSTNYCVKVELYDGDTWRIYEPCAPATGGSIKVSETETLVDEVRVALCLQRRQDICSQVGVAEIVAADGDDLPVSTIIIVAAICGSIVLVLLIILIVLCCRRHTARKKEAEVEAASRRATGNTANNIKVKGIDNPVMERAPEMVDMDDPGRTAVFSTNTSNMQPHNGNYVMFDRQQQHQQRQQQQHPQHQQQQHPQHQQQQHHQHQQQQHPHHHGNGHIPQTLNG